MSPPQSHDAAARSRFLGLTFGQAILFVTQIAGVVWLTAGIKSDTRDNTTRISQHDKDIADLRSDRKQDREDTAKILTDINAKVGNLDISVGKLLERTDPKNKP